VYPIWKKEGKNLTTCMINCKYFTSFKMGKQKQQKFVREILKISEKTALSMFDNSY
jgi:hypothetical protein